MFLHSFTLIFMAFSSLFSITKENEITFFLEFAPLTLKRERKRFILIYKKDAKMKIDESKRFVYRPLSFKGEMLLANDGDSFTAPFFEEIRYLLHNVNSLFSSYRLRVYPLSYKESPMEVMNRNLFKKESYLLVACIIDEDMNIISFLLVDKFANSHGMVIDKKNLEAIVSFYQGVYIEEIEGEPTPLDVFLPSLNGDLFLPSTNKKPLNLGGVKEKEEEEELEEEGPQIEVQKTFEPSKKKKIKDLGLSKKLYEEEKEKAEEEEVQVEVTKTAFVPNSKKKIKDLGSFNEKPFVKPKKAEIKELKKTTPVSLPIEEKQPKPTPVTPSFVPVSSKKPPKIIDEKKTSYRVSPSLIYRPLTSKKGSRLFLSLPDDPHKEKVMERLSSIKKARIAPNCIFAPSLLEENSSFLKGSIIIDLDRYGLFAYVLDRNDEPCSYLLFDKEDIGFCFALLPGNNPLITMVSLDGMEIDGHKETYYALFDKLFPKKQEKEIEIEEKEEEPPLIEINLEEDEETPLIKAIEIEEEEPVKKMVRRVFITALFQRRLAKFLSFHGKEAEDTINGIYEFLLTADEESLRLFLLDESNKKLQGISETPVYKFPFSNKGEYAAVRIMYTRGDALASYNRRYEDNDFVILTMSYQNEHERQREIAKSGITYLGKQSILEQILLDNDSKEGLDYVAYPSKEQFRQLEESEANLPTAILGTAGSGKTLLSYQCYLDLSKLSGMRVLYITYQKALVKAAEKTLRSMGNEDVDCMTYRDFILKLFGSEEARRFQTKDKYRAWFFDKVDSGYDKEFIKDANTLSPNKEDAFMVAYLFYRGLIEGSLKSAEKKGILDEKSFFGLAEKEEGISLEQKKAIYRIAKSYEKYLQEIDGMTDNKFALKIIELGMFLERYDAIIVDEYQDLTEIQLLSITRLLKENPPHRLYLFGDDNQAINPSILNVSSLGRVIMGAFKDRPKPSFHSLSSSYRNGPNLLSYINEVLSLKDKVIGKDKQENALAKKSFRNDEADAFVVTLFGKPLFLELLSLVQKQSADTAFLFPSANSRDLAKKEFQGLLSEDFLSSYFLSIEESKGREWDSVILVSYFSTNIGLFESMLGDRKLGRHSTLHRMLFNRYYVGLTRARNRVFVYEKDDIRKTITYEKLLHGLSEISSKEAIAPYFENRIPDEDWIKQGDNLFRKDDYEGALRCYKRIQDEEKAKPLKDKAILYMDIFMGKINRKEAISALLSYQDYPALMDYYFDNGLEDRRRFLLSLTDQSIPLKEKKELLLSIFDSLYEEEEQVYGSAIIALYSSSIRRKLRRKGLHKNKQGIKMPKEE